MGRSTPSTSRPLRVTRSQTVPIATETVGSSNSGVTKLTDRDRFLLRCNKAHMSNEDIREACNTRFSSSWSLATTKRMVTNALKKRGSVSEASSRSRRSASPTQDQNNKNTSNEEDRATRLQSSASSDGSRKRKRNDSEKSKTGQPARKKSNTSNQSIDFADPVDTSEHKPNEEGTNTGQPASHDSQRDGHRQASSTSHTGQQHPKNVEEKSAVDTPQKTQNLLNAVEKLVDEGSMIEQQAEVSAQTPAHDASMSEVGQLQSCPQRHPAPGNLHVNEATEAPQSSRRAIDSVTKSQLLKRLDGILALLPLTSGPIRGRDSENTVETEQQTQIISRPVLTADDATKKHTPDAAIGMNTSPPQSKKRKAAVTTDANASDIEKERLSPKRRKSNDAGEDLDVEANQRPSAPESNTPATASHSQTQAKQDSPDKKHTEPDQTQAQGVGQVQEASTLQVQQPHSDHDRAVQPSLFSSFAASSSTHQGIAEKPRPAPFVPFAAFAPQGYTQPESSPSLMTPSSTSQVKTKYTRPGPFANFTAPDHKPVVHATNMQPGGFPSFAAPRSTPQMDAETTRATPFASFAAAASVQCVDSSNQTGPPLFGALIGPKPAQRKEANLSESTSSSSSPDEKSRPRPSWIIQAGPAAAGTIGAPTPPQDLAKRQPTKAPKTTARPGSKPSSDSLWVGPQNIPHMSKIISQSNNIELYFDASTREIIDDYQMLLAGINVGAENLFRSWSSQTITKFAVPTVRDIEFQMNSTLGVLTGSIQRESAVQLRSAINCDNVMPDERLPDTELRGTYLGKALLSAYLHEQIWSKELGPELGVPALPKELMDALAHTTEKGATDGAVQHTWWKHYRKECMASTDFKKNVTKLATKVYKSFEKAMLLVTRSRESQLGKNTSRSAVLRTLESAIKFKCDLERYSSKYEFRWVAPIGVQFEPETMQGTLCIGEKSTIETIPVPDHRVRLGMSSALFECRYAGRNVLGLETVEIERTFGASGFLSEKCIAQASVLLFDGMVKQTSSLMRNRI